jgi:hypothetical protein
MKYNGCHFENISFAIAFAPLECDLQTTTAFASIDSAAATMHETAAGRTMLPLGPRYPLTHSERYALFKRAVRHTQQMAVTADIARKQSVNRVDVM